jgi:RecA-family ATPase
MSQPKPFTVKPITSRQLAELALPDLRFPIADLMPEGLALMVGRPKLGKSWAVLQCAIALATGGTFLERPTVPSDVLLIGSEDSKRRIKNRQKASIGTDSEIDRLEIFTVEDGFPRADEGGLDYIARWLADHPGGVVFIDTLGKFRSWEQKGSAYGADIKALEPIQALALKQHSLILCTHHDNKNLDIEGLGKSDQRHTGRLGHC